MTTRFLDAGDDLVCEHCTKKLRKISDQELKDLVANPPIGDLPHYGSPEPELPKQDVVRLILTTSQTNSQPAPPTPARGGIIGAQPSPSPILGPSAPLPSNARAQPGGNGRLILPYP